MSSLRLFQKTAAAPSGIADCIFKSAGRLTVVDQGYFSIITKLMLKVCARLFFDLHNAR